MRQYSPHFYLLILSLILLIASILLLWTNHFPFPYSQSVRYHKYNSHSYYRQPQNQLDICGVIDGDGSSCRDILLFSGLLSTHQDEENKLDAEQVREDANLDQRWKLRETLEDYVNLHHSIMSNGENSDGRRNIPKRYVVFDDEPEAGLGNRFQGMVATFLYAIVSKRYRSTNSILINIAYL